MFEMKRILATARLHAAWNRASENGLKRFQRNETKTDNKILVELH